jgi:tetratricopeptide (TPR) repeat protein
MQNSLSEWDQDLSSDEDEIYRYFYRALQRTEGFGLFFVRCVEGERNKLLIERLQQDLPKKKIERLTLDRPVEDGNLYKIISQLPNRNEIDVLFIAGIEKSLEPYIQPGYGGQGDYYKRDTVPRVLGHLNLQRERFRDDFPFAIVFLVPLFALKYFMLRSPDFFDWRSGLFEFPTNKNEVALASFQMLSIDYDLCVQLTHEERLDLLRDIQSLIDENNLLPEQLLPEMKSDLWLKQGMIWAADKNFHSAIVSYDHALELNPNFDEALINRGAALFNLGRYEEALADYDRASESRSNHYAWYNRGTILCNLGRYEEAINAYDRALAIKPDYASAWNNRGVTLSNLGRDREAITSYKEALKTFSNDANVIYNQACCYALQADIEAAIAHIQQAIALDPNYREMAKTDSDFDRIRDDQRFQNLLTGED